MPNTSLSTKRVRLVLGSGGARGMAHIGVIEALEEAGYQIREVAGCSMGAVVGGIYCAGYLKEYKAWLLELTKLDVFKLLDFTFSAQGFVKGERVFRAMEKFVGYKDIENLAIPFTAVATDLLHRKEVHYRSGSLFHALRASIGIPTVFTPLIEGKSQLVDGGILNPLPLNALHPEPGDVIVAVNLNANISPAANVVNKEKAAYLKMLDALRTQVLKQEIKREKETLEKLNFFDLIVKSYDMTQDRLTEMMIDVYKPDVTVNIGRESCGVFEFFRAKEMIDEGRKALHKALAI